jgi:two-component system chemotaxis response regulator CheB
MEKRDIVVIGASAGGITALKEFVSGLPENFAGAIFVVLHIPPYTESHLALILSKAGKLKAMNPKDGQEVEDGMIYVAPADHHMILEKGKIVVKRGPKENRFRPSIDALFRSAAYEYGTRVIGIILSGMLNDGISGLWTIRRHGGIAIIQTPEDAEQPQLPENALEELEADYMLDAIDMPPLVAGLVSERAPKRNKFTQEELKLLKTEVIIATRGDAFEMGIMNMGELTPFTCPECAGALVRLVEGNILRYRCHTGHAYTASSLLSEISESVESLMWQCMRGLEETNLLLKSIADHFDTLKDRKSAALFRKKAKSAAARARSMHGTVLRQDQDSEDKRLNKGPK